MLAQLEKIRGIEEAAANHAGTRLRLQFNHADKVEPVLERVAKVLVKAGVRARRLPKSKAARALASETWKGSDRVADLSMMEATALAEHWRDNFSPAERLSQEKAARLRRMIEAVTKARFRNYHKSKLEQPSPEALEARLAAWLRQIETKAQPIVGKAGAARLRASMEADVARWRAKAAARRRRRKTAKDANSENL